MRWVDRVSRAVQGIGRKVVPRPGGDPGGVPARAVVVDVLQGPRVEPETHAVWNRVTFTARVGAGPTSTVEGWVSMAAWEDLVPGRDVPVRVDPATGAVVGLDGDAYEREVLGRDPQDPMTAFPILGDPMAADAPPVEGVTLEQWAAVTARIAKGGVGPFEQDAFAASLGVPPGRWAAVNAEWNRRVAADQRIALRFSAAYAAELQR